MESLPNDMSDAHKRRTTRIVQAVPLTASGVDALGRPFQERTSTLIINCHGCRYQSKHYVLKNMWVSLEIPHPEPGRQPRTSRARVTWIQRPRTVRELFQVGVELENPGNLWGIAFAPSDWFPASERAPARISQSAANEQDAVPAAGNAPAVEHARATDHPHAAEGSPLESNLRTMPMNNVEEPSLALTRQMSHLVNEANLQLHEALRDSVAEIVSREAQAALATLEARINQAAERAVQAAAAPAAEQALRAALAQAEQTGEAQLRAARERWNRELAEHLEKAGSSLTERFSLVAHERAAAFENQIETRLNLTVEKADRAAANVDLKMTEAQKTIADFVRQEAESAATSLNEVGQQLDAKTEQARSQLAEIDYAARRIQDAAAAAAEAAQSGLQSRLDADLAAATSRWNQQVETSLEGTVRKATERLAQHSGEAVVQAENDMKARIAAVAAAFAEQRAIAEANLESLRGALAGETGRALAAVAQVQSAAQAAEQWPARIGELTNTAQQELEQRAADLVEVQSRELSRRADQDIAAWTDRLQPALEASGQQAVARLGVELDQQLNSRLERAGQVLADLERGTAAAENASRSHQETLATASEREIEAAVARLQKSLDQLEHNFGEAGRAATAKWFAELETKATETTHSTFESLFKTADWYEKKVQNQMQTTLDKGLEQATGNLREKAGEISGLFATELDHYSRSFVEHTHNQVEDAARDTLERVGKQAGEIAANSQASIAQQARNHGEAALAKFQTKSTAAIEQLSTQIEAQAAQSRAALDAGGREASARFEAALSQHTEQALTGARQELASQVALAAENVRLTGETAERQLSEAVLTVSDSAVSEYKNRLENASNSWLVATVTKLNQQSEQHIESVARTTEARLRETCNQVFTDLGETLRARMLALFGLQDTAKTDSDSK